MEAFDYQGSLELDNKGFYEWTNSVIFSRISEHVSFWKRALSIMKIAESDD